MGKYERFALMGWCHDLPRLAGLLQAMGVAPWLNARVLVLLEAIRDTRNERILQSLVFLYIFG